MLLSGFLVIYGSMESVIDREARYTREDSGTNWSLPYIDLREKKTYLNLCQDSCDLQINNALHALNH